MCLSIAAVEGSATVSVPNRNPPNQSPYLIEAAAIPAPKFKLFDVAILHYEGEHGQVSNELVQIVGLSWNPVGTYVVDWWYHVCYLYQPTGIEGHLSPGHKEDCLENELRSL